MRTTCPPGSPTWALQVHGGIGYWEPNEIERIYRDARGQHFEEGTNAVQKAVIAREVLKSGPSEPGCYPAVTALAISPHLPMALASDAIDSSAR